jgi:hypothetical protein
MTDQLPTIIPPAAIVASGDAGMVWTIVPVRSGVASLANSQFVADRVAGYRKKYP